MVKIALAVLIIIFLPVISLADSQKEIISPDGKVKAIIFGNKTDESIIEIYDSEKLLLKKDYTSKDGEHGVIVEHAEWTPDSKFFVYGMYSSGGHQPWHSPIDFYYREENKIYELENYLSEIEAIAQTDFKITAPDTIQITIINLSKRGGGNLSSRKVNLYDIVTH